MNPASIKSKDDLEKAREEYINNLRLEVSNNQRAQNAIDTLKTTGQVIQKPTDNRSTTEKMLDTEEVKMSIRKGLSTIMDGTNLNQLLVHLGRSPIKLYFVANRLTKLVEYFQPRYKLGVSYLVFLSTISQMISKLSQDEKEQYGFRFTAKSQTTEEPSISSREKPTTFTTKKGLDKDDIQEKRREEQQSRGKVKRQAEMRRIRTQIQTKSDETSKRQEKKQEKREKAKEEAKQTKKEEKIKSGTSTQKAKREEVIFTKRKLYVNQRKRKAPEDFETPALKRANKVNIVEDEKIEGKGLWSREGKKDALVKHMKENNLSYLTLPNRAVVYTLRKIRMFKKDTFNSPLQKLYERYTPRAELIYGEGHSPSESIKKQNIIFGSGIKVHKKPVTLQTDKAVLPSNKYSQFGRYIINNDKLENDILMLRYAKGGQIASLPTQKVSKNLIKAVSNIVNTQKLDYEDISNLQDEEKTHLHTILEKSRLADKFKVPNPNQCDFDKENHRFQILKGEILAGNNSPSLIKEFKLLLVKLMNQKRLPKGQGSEIMSDLLLLGY